MFTAGVSQDSYSFYALSLLLRVTGNSVVDAYQLNVYVYVGVLKSTHKCPENHVCKCKGYVKIPYQILLKMLPKFQYIVVVR